MTTDDSSNYPQIPPKPTPHVQTMKDARNPSSDSRTLAFWFFAALLFALAAIPVAFFLALAIRIFCAVSLVCM